MFKHILYLIILSLLLIFAIPYAHAGIQILLKGHVIIINALSQVFAGGETGRAIKSLIAILVIPFVAGGIIAGIYWVFKRSKMPYIEHVIWVLWLVLATAIVCTQG